MHQDFLTAKPLTAVSSPSELVAKGPQKVSKNFLGKKTKERSPPLRGGLNDYTFDLPQELIAQHPLPHRTASRLLVLARDDSAARHAQFVDIVGLLRRGDVLVLNDTRVFPARLVGRKIPGAGAVELLLCRATASDAWVCLLQVRSGRAHVGQRIQLLKENGQAGIMATLHSPVPDEPGAWHVRFDGDAVHFACNHGQVPLPAYMRREMQQDDRSRYQTVFAHPEKTGSCAAPTAGLHFDNALLHAVCQQGVEVATVTLHVGPGTFVPAPAASA